MRISDWSSDVCSSDLLVPIGFTHCWRRFLDSAISTTVVPALVAWTHWHQRVAMSCHDGIPASRKRLPPEWQDLQTARALGPGNKSRDDSLRQRLWTTAVPRPTFRGMTQQDGDYRTTRLNSSH